MAEQFSDEYFLNLTMDYDHRDDEIYPKWAVWCAKSDDKYYIDGKDHHFYTHVRTNEEIAQEKKKRELFEFRHEEGMKISDEVRQSEAWHKYERVLDDMIMRDNISLDAKPISFEEFSKVEK